jgi:hypothetical protein
MGVKRKKSEARRRQAHIMVRVTDEEKEKLKLKAAMCGHSAPSYIRNLALAYPLRSMVDQYAVDQLIRSRADLGRLGGLFKLWLTKNQDNKILKLGDHTFEDVEALVQEIESKQEKLLEYAKVLIHSINRR